MELLHLISGIILASATGTSSAQAIEANSPHLHGSAAIPNNRNALNSISKHNLLSLIKLLNLMKFLRLTWKGFGGKVI